MHNGFKIKHPLSNL